MDFLWSQLAIALPEIYLLCAASVVLLVDVFLTEKHRYITYLLTQLTLLGAFLITLPAYSEHSIAAVSFSANYISDKMAVLCKLFIYLFSMFALAYSREYITVRRMARGDYYLLGLFAILGMSIMVSAYSFLTIFLGLELLSLPLYAMVAMQRDSNQAIEAAMKYFVLGSLASGIMLYGISLLYGSTGNIQLAMISEFLLQKPDAIAMVGLIFILAGLIFKFGAVPFHMWVPDVYQGAPTSVTLFLAGAPKIAAFAILMRILVQAMPMYADSWIPILTTISVLSMFFGNVLAIAQTNFKRMLAYSSIAHIGYTFLGIIAGPHSAQGYSAAMFYIATYVLVAAGAFAVITLMSRGGVELDKLEDYRGLNSRSPWLAFMLLLLLFSMAGVPPTVGFLAKLGLIEALMEAHMVWLAVAALLFSLIGAYYYLRVVMVMYFEEPSEGTANQRINLPADSLIFISINGAAALMLGVLPSFFIDLCRISVA